MSATCSLFALFGDPWPSYLLPSQRDRLLFWYSWAFLMAQMINGLQYGRGLGLIPGLGRSPGRGHGNPFHYSCLENPMDRGAWWATVHRFTKEELDMTEAT